MSEDYQFEANNPRFVFHMATMEEYLDLKAQSPEVAAGYLRATSDFCDVILDRVTTELDYTELKAELLGIIKERRAFAELVSAIQP